MLYQRFFFLCVIILTLSVFEMPFCKNLVESLLVDWVSNCTRVCSSVLIFSIIFFNPVILYFIGLFVGVNFQYVYCDKINEWKKIPRVEDFKNFLTKYLFLVFVDFLSLF